MYNFIIEGIKQILDMRHFNILCIILIGLYSLKVK